MSTGCASATGREWRNVRPQTDPRADQIAVDELAVGGRNLRWHRNLLVQIAQIIQLWHPGTPT
eukprot:10886289-Lingulodinium_polyedra.AAC.1